MFERMSAMRNDIQGRCVRYLTESFYLCGVEELWKEKSNYLIRRFVRVPMRLVSQSGFVAYGAAAINSGLFMRPLLCAR